MIQAKELRIGNKLQKETGEIFTVLRLDNSNDVLVEEQRGLLTLGYNLFGIPLTPEILEKCGFINSRDGWYDKEYFTDCFDSPEVMNITVNAITFRCGTCDKSNVESPGMYAMTGKEIQHLHHLQNLYFALCGTELTINLPVKTKGFIRDQIEKYPNCWE